jgi:predicted RNA methylase
MQTSTGDEAKRLASMLGFMRSTGMPVAPVLALAGHLREIPKEVMDWVDGPIVVHTGPGGGWPYPHWMVAQIKEERVDVALGLAPEGTIVGPTEISAVMHSASHEAPLSQRAADLYLWASINAMARKESTSAEAQWARLYPPGSMHYTRPITDDEVLSKNGRLRHDYRQLSEEVLRKVARGRKGGATPFWPELPPPPAAQPAGAPPTKRVAIPPEVAAVLSTVTCTGNAVVLPAQLDRPLYEATDKILRALGGKWNRGRKAHVFASDPALVLADALGAGSVVDRKVSLQLFETPAEIAARMASGLLPGAAVLEPSAGTGRLVRAALEAGAARIQAVEIDEANCQAITSLFASVQVRRADFLSLHPQDLPSADAVLMNPPFKGGLDIKHVQHALRFLRPGGSLTAIMSPHAFQADSRPARDFRALVTELGGQVETLPAGTFKDEGTTVETRLIRLQQP